MEPVAARLVGGGVLKIAPAGKSDGYNCGVRRLLSERRTFM